MAKKKVVFTGVSDGESASESGGRGQDEDDGDDDMDDDDDSSNADVMREMIRRRKQHRYQNRLILECWMFKKGRERIVTLSITSLRRDFGYF